MNEDNLFYEEGDPICATVGTNGYHTISDYADGFFEGAEFIIYECLTRLDNRKNNLDTIPKRVNITEDIIVYPICFNIRHSIELYLKEIIKNLIYIYRKKGAYKNELDKTEHHDINKLWDIVKAAHFANWRPNSEISRALIFDERFDNYVDLLDKYITDWGNIDPTGQTFRYPFSNESKRHLEDQNLISVLSLFVKSKKHHENLKKFRDFSYLLKSEYDNNQYTKLFTYTQLVSIAKELPDFIEWKNINFEEKISELCDKYKVESKRSIKEIAINEMVKKDYFLSSLIGLDLDFIFLSKDKFLNFYNFILANKGEIERINNLDYISAFKNAQCLNQSITEFLLKYNDNELLDLLTLIYLGRDNDAVSAYKKFFEYIRDTFNSREDILKKILEKKGNIEIYMNEVMRKFGKDKLWNIT
ncbi:hypothetical protein Q7513_08820 [Glaesserella parasuis]|nr:hypothetical protein [Glaesserella parasuis]